MALNLDFSISKTDLDYLKKETSIFLNVLKKAIKSKKIKAIPFIGGSLAKKTMIQSDNYDVDIFVRFDKSYHSEELSDLLEKIIKSIHQISKLQYRRLHGSRDYIQIERSKKLAFEIIPVRKIISPKQAENTTDLSYFHVNYVKNKINNNLVREISLTKRFFKAQKVYGAESYIQGFSGYAVECLIIYYNSFKNMIKSFIRSKDQIVIDPKNYFKKQNILLEMNESKTLSPIVLVDPTFKERNVLAALSQETFNKLKIAIKKYLKNYSSKYFEIKDIDEDEMKKSAKLGKLEYIKIILLTDKQPGDIAGTKLKKFSKFLVRALSSHFVINREEFDYKLTNNAFLYLLLKSKKEILKKGPPISMKSNVLAFKKQNKNTFVKKGHIYARLNTLGAKQFIDSFVAKYNNQIKSMDITNVELCS